MAIVLDIIETVWNSYKVVGVDENFFAPRTFIQGLQEDFDGNIWKMQSELSSKGIIFQVELGEACFEYIDSDHSSTTVREEDEEDV